MRRWMLAGAWVTSAALCATVAWSQVSGSGAPAPTAPTAGSSATGQYDQVDAIPYSLMSPAEQAVIDRGRDTTAWNEVGDTYAAAAREQAQRAAASAALLQLGVDDASQGVVP